MDLNKTVKEFLLYLRVERNSRPATLDAYRKDLKYLQSFLEEKNYSLNIEDISKLILHEFLVEISTKHNFSPATVARLINCLRSFFNYCFEQDYILTTPMKKIKPPRIPKKLPVFLKEGELSRLLRSPELNKTDDLWLQDKVMLYTLAYCGIRTAELLSIDFDDINFSAATVKIKGKGNKERLQPIKDLLLDVLWEYLQQRLPLKNRALLVNKYGNRLDRTCYYKRFTNLINISGLDNKYTPHKLRHTFATQLAENNISQPTIQELMGHEDPKSTQVYTHIQFKTLKKAVDELPKY